MLTIEKKDKHISFTFDSVAANAAENHIEDY